MPAKKILFPTDFSHTGDAAFVMATSLARDMEAKLLIVHVEEPPVAYGGGGVAAEFFDGQIDSPAIYGRALTPLEVDTEAVACCPPARRAGRWVECGTGHEIADLARDPLTAGAISPSSRNR